MKIRLEEREIINRGVILQSETPDELAVLRLLKENRGLVVDWKKLDDGNLELTFAPTLSPVR